MICSNEKKMLEVSSYGTELFLNTINIKLIFQYVVSILIHLI